MDKNILLSKECTATTDRVDNAQMDNILIQECGCQCGKINCEFAADFLSPSLNRAMNPLSDNGEIVYENTCEYQMVPKNDDTGTFSSSRS